MNIDKLRPRRPRHKPGTRARIRELVFKALDERYRGFLSTLLRDDLTEQERVAIRQLIEVPTNSK